MPIYKRYSLNCVSLGDSPFVLSLVRFGSV